MATSRFFIVGAMALFLSACGCRPPMERTRQAQTSAGPANKIVARARLEVARSVAYDASYRQISFPDGDVPTNRGCCADLVVRALREIGMDLQVAISADRKKRPQTYPVIGGTRRPDSNIDHRRLQNHLVYFEKYGQRLPNSIEADALSTWKPGDLVYGKLPGGRLHCGIISDRKSPDGTPLLIHNRGPYATEDEGLRYLEMLGHFRVKHRFAAR